MGWGRGEKGWFLNCVLWHDRFCSPSLSLLGGTNASKVQLLRKPMYCPSGEGYACRIDKTAQDWTTLLFPDQVFHISKEYIVCMLLFESFPKKNWNHLLWCHREPVTYMVCLTIFGVNMCVLVLCSLHVVRIKRVELHYKWRLVVPSVTLGKISAS